MKFSHAKRFLAAAAAAILAAGCTGPDATPQDRIARNFREFTLPSLSQRISGWQSWPSVKMDQPEHVAEGRRNWTGFQDASMIAGVDVYGDTLSILAVVNDDESLVQPRERLVFPGEFRGAPPFFAGDAISLKLTPLDRALNPFEAVIELGSEGLYPRFVVVSAPRGETGPAPGAAIEVERVPGGYEVYARVREITEYGLWPFHNTPYAIEATLHDMDGDGDPKSVSTLRVKTETRP